jgi:transcriptional regulator with XRE-family HTH domain
MTAASTPDELAGRAIRLMRSTHQVSLRRLAKIVGCDPGHLSRVEQGKREMTVDLFNRITAALATLPAPTTSPVLVPTPLDEA